MFELFSHDAKIPFTHWGKFTVPLSFALMLVAAVLLFKPGFNLGLDFTGGTLIELATLVQFSHASVVGQYAILMDRCRFTVIEGPEIDGSEKGAITKFTMSCMARYDKGADGKWKALFSVPGRPSSTAQALLKF